jgi:hypothetical protein
LQIKDLAMDKWHLSCAKLAIRLSPMLEVRERRRAKRRQEPKPANGANVVCPGTNPICPQPNAICPGGNTQSRVEESRVEKTHTQYSVGAACACAREGQPDPGTVDSCPF